MFLSNKITIFFFSFCLSLSSKIKFKIQVILIVCHRSFLVRMCEIILKRFDFDPEFGFLIPAPLLRLDEYFDPWTDLVTELETLRKTPDVFRERVR